VDLDCDIICENIKNLRIYLDDCWEQRKVFKEKVERYLYLVNGNAKEEVEIFLSKNHTFEEYKNAIIKYHDISMAILADILPTVNIGAFQIDFSEIVNILDKQANTLKNNIIVYMKSAYSVIEKK